MVTLWSKKQKIKAKTFLSRWFLNFCQWFWGHLRESLLTGDTLSWSLLVCTLKNISLIFTNSREETFLLKLGPELSDSYNIFINNRFLLGKPIMGGIYIAHICGTYMGGIYGRHIQWVRPMGNTRAFWKSVAHWSHCRPLVLHQGCCPLVSLVRFF